MIVGNFDAGLRILHADTEMEITMKTLLTMTAVATLAAGASFAETTIVQTQPSTSVTQVESDPNTTGGGALALQGLLPDVVAVNPHGIPVLGDGTQEDVGM